MPRIKKESVPISARIEKNTFERLQKFCADSGLGKTVTLERALNMYIDDYCETLNPIEIQNFPKLPFAYLLI